jgi:hypothetical protein
VEQVLEGRTEPPLFGDGPLAPDGPKPAEPPAA